MNTTTLRGIFPDPKPVHRRNFIKENIKQVKQMQGLLQESGLLNKRDDKFRTTPTKASSNTGPPPNKSKQRVMRSLSQSRASQHQHSAKQQSQQSRFTNSRQVSSVVPPKLDLKAKSNIPKESADQKFTNRAMQTERTEDLSKLYETGVIKYPSPNAVVKSSPRKERKKRLDQGEPNTDIIDGLDKMDISERDYVKGNMKNLKRASKQDTNRDPTKAPPTYQKGVLPKYLRDRKEENSGTDNEPECPPGHVLLPDEERKETLRVLRQSYADRIQELNSMPVRSDTLRMRKRKIEIEEELKKIDEGIKVFQRPKVFVKINA